MVSFIISLFCLIGYFSCWVYFIKCSSARLPVSVMAIFGVIVPPLGVIVGLWYLAAGPREVSEKSVVFDQSNMAEVVDFIDRQASASVIASNSEWLKRNWHPMSDQEKQQWVKERFSSLNRDLPNVHSSPEFINAMQEADKKYQRAKFA